MAQSGEVLDRARAGDPIAFQALIAPHVDTVRRLARSFARSWDDADDIAQEALTKAFRSIGQYRGEAALSTWLYRVTRNACIDWYRSKTVKARESEEASDEASPDSRPGPESLLREKSRAEVLYAAIAQLEPTFRTALVLYDIEGLSYEEVAKVEQVPIGTVRSRLNRARKQLSELLRSSRLQASGSANDGTYPAPTSSMKTRTAL